MLKKLVAAFGMLLIPIFAVAQTGQDAVITGTVTDASTGDPLLGANVYIGVLGVGDATGEDGTYSILVSGSMVNGQDVVVTADFIGYASVTTTLTLTSGDHSVDIAMGRDVLGLQAIVVTGVVGATPMTKMPFAVGRLTAADLIVPASSAEAAIRGKIAGVKVIKGSGRPGTAASVQLRGATSINASGRTQSPLYIVDGVILSAGATMADIDARDIETIEVIKGAAGASLYCSRAAAGVINIRTARGKNLAIGQTRITFRTETGTNELPNRIKLVQNHFYKVNAAGDFIDADNAVVDPRDAGGGRVIDAFAPDSVSGIWFQDKAYKWVTTGVPEDEGGGAPTLLPSGGFDHLDRFFIPGEFVTSTISIARNSASTNFFASFVNNQEPGILFNLNGNVRNSLRVNLDHRIRESLRLSVSTYYSQSKIDDADDLLGSAFFALTFMPPDVDLLLKDENDYERTSLNGAWDPKLGDDAQIFIVPDPFNALEPNPLYELLYEIRDTRRNRFLSNMSLNYQPLSWLSLEANLSLDRTERSSEFYRAKGYKTETPGLVQKGTLNRENRSNEAINADFTASFHQSIGVANLRAKLRYTFEQDVFERTNANGSDLTVGGVRSLEAAAIPSIGSGATKILAEGFFLIGGLDIADRYIIDVLTRQDRSSLFGPDERDQTYYRVSAAYRISEEPFWVLKGLINEFKIRYSQGTAGNRPSFSAQYETYGLSNGVLGAATTLGNASLKPEFATETEIGLDFAIMNRIYIQLTQATSIVEDQILLVPLSGTYGVESQWKNAGTLETSTLEASLQANILRVGSLSWDVGFVFDKTTQEITEFTVPAYTWAPPGSQGMTIFFNREGETLGTMYGIRWMTSTADLPTGATASEFAVNDDGYLVWVGAGNSYTDGISNILWGTSSSDGYDWGMPIAELDADGKEFLEIGVSVPDFSYGFTTTLRLGGLSLYALFEGQEGGNIYNMTGQWGMRDNKVAAVDQLGKAEGDKKPTAYYQVLYAVRKPNSNFVEDGSYLKLQELSLRYNLSIPGLVNRITVGAVGRNLFTWTNYSGYDPEVGTSGGQGGSAVLARFDGYQYPNFRSISIIVEVAL